VSGFSRTVSRGAGPQVAPQTDLDPTPQHPLPINQLCQYTAHGLLRTYGPAPRETVSRSVRALGGPMQNKSRIQVSSLSVRTVAAVSFNVAGLCSG